MLVAIFGIDAGNDANCATVASGSSATSTSTASTLSALAAGTSSALVCLPDAMIVVIKGLIIVALIVVLVQLCFNYMVYHAVSENDHEKIKRYVKCMVCFYIINLIATLMGDTEKAADGSD